MRLIHAALNLAEDPFYSVSESDSDDADVYHSCIHNNNHIIVNALLITIKVIIIYIHVHSSMLLLTKAISLKK